MGDGCTASTANKHRVCPSCRPCTLGGDLHRPKPIRETPCPDAVGASARRRVPPLSHPAPSQGQSSWGALVCRAEFLAVDCCSAAPSPACKPIPRASGLPAGRGAEKHEGRGLRQWREKASGPLWIGLSFPRCSAGERCSHPL